MSDAKLTSSAITFALTCGGAAIALTEKGVPFERYVDLAAKP